MTDVRGRVRFLRVRLTIEKSTTRGRRVGKPKCQRPVTWSLEVFVHVFLLMSNVFVRLGVFNSDIDFRRSTQRGVAISFLSRNSSTRPAAAHGLRDRKRITGWSRVWIPPLKTLKDSKCVCFLDFFFLFVGFERVLQCLHVILIFKERIRRRFSVSLKQ